MHVDIRSLVNMSEMIADASTSDVTRNLNGIFFFLFMKLLEASSHRTARGGHSSSLNFHTKHEDLVIYNLYRYIVDIGFKTNEVLYEHFFLQHLNSQD